MLLENTVTVPSNTKRIRWILGDQLALSHSWFEQKDEAVLYVIAELRQETDYAPHHSQKVCAFFAAMRNFADNLASLGHRVLHLDLDATAPFKDLPTLITTLCANSSIEHFDYQRPDEYRLQLELEQLSLPSHCTKTCYESEHFLLPYPEIEKTFTANKAVRMENFYRKMRKRFDVLMEGDQPRGDRWNFDAENRKKLKKQDIDALPAPLVFANDVKAIISRLERHKVKTIGVKAESIMWPINRDQALAQLKFFCDTCLPHFGTFQDAMTCNSPHRWSLYHARISFALNCKLLTSSRGHRRCDRSSRFSRNRNRPCSGRGLR